MSENVFVQLEKRLSHKEDIEGVGYNNKFTSLITGKSLPEKERNPETEIIKLNVGGKIFQTTRKTLTKKCKGTKRPNLFEEYLAKKTIPLLDENNIIFVDRNPQYFSYILDYLRMVDTNFDFKLPNDRSILDYLEREAEYYKLDGVRELLNKSNILTADQMQELMDMCGFKRNQHFTLLYRASQDGFSSNDFHAKCNGFTNTLTIIRTVDSYVFGGYTTAKWSRKGGYEHDSHAFIFSYINKSQKPKVFKCILPQYAIECNSACGPAFGKNDLHIASNSNVNEFSHSNLGTAYKHPLYEYGSNEARTFLAGDFSFQTNEIEVLKKEF